jgi:FtsP/CotA-like multicopper oxidase with cupredoxin domain
MKFIRRVFLLCCALAALLPALESAVYANESQACARPVVGSPVPEPQDVRSENGILDVALVFQSFKDAHGQMRYCYAYQNRVQAPTLRVQPGDTLILRLKNEATDPLAGTPQASAPLGNREHAQKNHMAAMNDGCANGAMSAYSTNLHFHGLDVPPVCHQDDVLHTLIQPGDPAFEYKVQIPKDESPGLYWYHPHVHGFSKAQVLGGASGAIVVEGIERANPQVAGLPERIFVIRDQDLLSPSAAPAGANAANLPPVLLDRDGDPLNTGTGSGTPAKDLSINFVSVPYPDYPPAKIGIKPGERQLWRFLNASAITYLNLQLLFGKAPQMVGVVAIDGIPIIENGIGNGVILENHLGVPPGGRMEVIVTGPPKGVSASLVTRSVNTGPGGENDPTRPLANIVASDDATEPQSTLPTYTGPPLRSATPWLGDVKPARTRKLYFSEKLQDPKDPNSPTTFYITLDGEEPKLFDPYSSVPEIVVHQGDVEDWIIENRSQELHDFHIHQTHFMLLDWYGLKVDEPFLRDTVNVPFWDGKSAIYPSIKVRIDFRDPNIVGTFVYHCHLLEHEDGGMMGLIRVEPANAKSAGALPSRKTGRRLCGPVSLVAALEKSSNRHTPATKLPLVADVNISQHIAQ